MVKTICYHLVMLIVTLDLPPPQILRFKNLPQLTVTAIPNTPEESQGEVQYQISHQGEVQYQISQNIPGQLLPVHIQPALHVVLYHLALDHHCRAVQGVFLL